MILPADQQVGDVGGFDFHQARRRVTTVGPSMVIL